MFRDGFLAAQGSQDGARHRRARRGPVCRQSQAFFEIAGTRHTQIQRAHQNLGGGLIADASEGFLRRPFLPPGQAPKLAEHPDKLPDLTVFAAEAGAEHTRRLVGQLGEILLPFPEDAAEDIAQGRTGEECLRIAVGQSRRLRRQPPEFPPGHPLRIVEESHRRGGHQCAGAAQTRAVVLHGPQFPRRQDVQHPVFRTAAVVQSRGTADPAGDFAVLPPELMPRPFLQGLGHIANRRSHGARDLAPGQTHQQAVAGVGRLLGIAGHRQEAVDPLRAMAQAVAHRQSQQTTRI